MAMDKVAMAQAMITAMDLYVASLDDPKPEHYDRVKGMETLAEAIIDHIVNNMEIDIKGAFSSGVPVVNDGGSALKTAWSTQAPLTGVVS